MKSGKYLRLRYNNANEAVEKCMRLYMKNSHPIGPFMRFTIFGFQHTIYNLVEGK